MNRQFFSRVLSPDVEAGGAGRTVVWLWFTAPIALLVTIISVIGLVVPGFYRDPQVWQTQVVAQDFVDLVLVLPVLVGSGVLAARGSRHARLIWLGTLSYLVYTFIIYTFAVQHNPLFLVYVAVLACSLWAFIGGIVTLDWRAIKNQFVGNPRVKVISSILIVQASLFYLLWFSDEIPAALSGGMPQSLGNTGLLTNPVHVLDMAILLPAILLTGISLWRKQTIGYVLVTPILVNLVFQGLGIAAIMIISIHSGLPGTLSLAGIFLALSACNLTLLVWYVRGMKTSAP